MSRLVVSFGLAMVAAVVQGCGTGSEESGSTTEGLSQVAAAGTEGPHGAGIDARAVAKVASFSFQSRAGGFDVKQPSHVTEVEGSLIRFEPQRGLYGCATLTPQPRSDANALELETTSIRRDMELLSPAEPVLSADGGIEWDRGVAEERLTATNASVEQSWRFATAPAGEGDLRVEVEARGQGFLASTDTGLHFRDDPAGLGVRYGVATWIDATGAKFTISPTWDGSRISIVIPADVIDASEYPALLDPTVHAEYEIDKVVAGVAEPDTQKDPDIAWNQLAGGSELYLVVWTDLSCGALEADVRGIRVDKTGALQESKPLAIAFEPSKQSNPSVAYDFEATEWVVAYDDDSSGSGADIYVRPVPQTVTNGATAVADELPDGPVQIIGLAGDDTDPDIACVSAGANSNCFVVWSGTGSCPGSCPNLKGNIYEDGAANVANAWTIDNAAGSQTVPSVAGIGRGQYAVVYNDDNPNPDVYVARGVDPTIPNAGARNTLNTGVAKPNSIAAAATRFLAVYVDSANQARAQYLSAAGNPVVGGALPLNPVAAGTDGPVAVAFSGANFKTAWYRDGAAAGCGAGDIDQWWTRTLTSTEAGPHGAAAPAGACEACGTNKGIALTRGDAGAVYAARTCSADVLWNWSSNLISEVVAKQTHQSIAYDQTNDVYYAVWQHEASGTFEVYGALITEGVGGVLTIDPDDGDLIASNASAPAVAWDGTKFAVAWVANGTDLKYRDVDDTGAMGAVQNVAAGITFHGDDDRAPRIGCNMASGATRNCLVVYSYEVAGPPVNFDIGAYRLYYNLGAFTTAFVGVYASNSYNDVEPAVFWDGGYFLLPWEQRDDLGGGGFIDSDIRAVFVTSTGTVHNRGDQGDPCHAGCTCVALVCTEPAPMYVANDDNPGAFPPTYNFEQAPDVSAISWSDALFVYGKSNDPFSANTWNVIGRELVSGWDLKAANDISSGGGFNGDERFPRLSVDRTTPSGSPPDVYDIVYISDYDHDLNSGGLLVIGDRVDKTGTHLAGGTAARIHDFPKGGDTAQARAEVATVGEYGHDGIVVTDGPLESMCRPRLVLSSVSF